MGTARLEETVNIRTRSVGRAVCRPYSDSEESDYDVLYVEEHDSALQRVNTRNEWSTQTTVDSCGERCAQLDDFKWFLPTDERAGDLSAPESEIDTSDSESGVDFFQTESTAQQLLCPPVVVHTRPMEGCHTAVPRRLRRGRDVRTADDAVAVDIRQVSTSSDTVFSRKIHRKSECVTTVVPKLAAAPQAAYEVVQPRPRDYDSLPPGSGCLDSPKIDTPEAAVSSMEVAGGSPPAEINISRSPDRLQTELSVATTEMASGSPPADIDICVVPDVLPIAMSVKTVMSDKSMEMDTPDGVVSRMEMTGGSPPVEIDISRGSDVLRISVTETEILGGSPPADIDIYVVPDMLQTEISVTTTEMAGGSPPADIDICVVPDVLPIAISIKSVVSDKSSEIDTPDAVVSSMEVAGGSPPAEIDISESLDVLQRAVSVTAVVSEKWMERFVINLKVLCSDGIAPDDDPARRSSDVGSDACIVQDPIPTVVSMRTVVTEEWMDRFVLDLVECRLFPGRVRWPGRSGRPCVRSIPLLFLLGGGGGGGRLPMHTP